MKAIIRNAIAIGLATSAVCSGWAGPDSSTTDSSLPTALPRVVVSRQVLNEEQLVGPNLQPEWTAERRFATTRIYVLPPWQIEFEQWWKGKYPRQGAGQHLFQSEIGIGLPYRLQFDLYENVEHTSPGGTRHSGVQVEMRWALAEWGKIPLNPTLYGEWKFNDHSPDAYEVKLLLGEEIAPRWHWGFNVFYEQEVAGGRGSEIGFSQAISYSALDGKLGVGVEMQLGRTSGPDFHGQPAVEFLLGPSVQWRPSSRFHLDLVPLFGVTGDSPRVEAFIVLGIDLGCQTSRRQVHAPVSGRSR